MNEEALNEAYQHFGSTGYTGSIEDFARLISSDSDALGVAFDHFKGTGYSDTIEDFSALMGVEAGKTNGATKSDAAVVPGVDTGLASEDGSLGLPPSTIPLGVEPLVSDQTRVERPIFDPRGEEISMIRGQQKEHNKGKLTELGASNFFSKSKIKELSGHNTISSLDLTEGIGVYARGDLQDDFKDWVDTVREIDPGLTYSLTDADADEVFDNLYGNTLQQEKDKASHDLEKATAQRGLDEGIPIGETVNNLNAHHIKNHGEMGQTWETDLAQANHELRQHAKGETMPRYWSHEGALERQRRSQEQIQIQRGEEGAGAYRVFHDFETGQNVGVPGSSESPSGTTAVDITDLYESYLASYATHSQGGLEKLNDRLLLEEAGYDMEGREIQSVRINDLNLRTRFKDYYNPKTKVFDIPLNKLNNNVLDVTDYSEFWSPNRKWYGKDAREENAFNDIQPVNFEGKPYANEEEFIDHLRVRNQQGVDLQAKIEAVWRLHHLNQDVTSIGDSKGGRFIQATMQGMGMSKEDIAKNIGYTDAALQDIVAQYIVPEAGLKLSEDQERYLERDFGDKLIETGGGLTGMMPALLGLNKMQGALGITRAIGGLTLPRYFAKGRQISQASTIQLAAKQGKSIDDLIDAGLITTKNATRWSKGSALLLGGVVEDIKMREGMGALGMEKFERGVGFGFYLGGKALPFNFQHATKWNQLNTALNLTAKNGSAFAIAVETGDAIHAVKNHLQNTEEFSTFIKENWSDYGEKFEDTILHLITGAGLGMTHLKSTDVKTYNQIKNFRIEAAGKQMDAFDALEKQAENEGVDLKDSNIWGEWLETQQRNGNENLDKVHKYQEDFLMANDYLLKSNSIEDWTDPVKGEKLHNEHLKPIADLYKSRGKNLIIEVTDRKLEQQYMDADGNLKTQEASALFQKLGDMSDPNVGKNTAKITINVKKSKGRGTVGHEALHAYLDLMFDGKPQLKEQFESTLRAKLESIKLNNGRSLYAAISEDKALQGDKRIKLEEMMTYTSEFLALKENQHLVDNKVLSSVSTFFNNVSKKVLGEKNGDFYSQQSLINMLGNFSRTGKVSELSGLDEYVEIGKASGEGIVASRPVESAKETKTRLEEIKKGIIENTKELVQAKPEGYQELIKENSQRLVGTESELGINDQLKMVDGILKQGDPRNLINQHIGNIKRETTTNKETGKEETKVVKGEDGKVVYESKFTKEDLKDINKGGTEEGQKAIRETLGEIFESELIRNMIFENSGFKPKRDADLSLEAQEFLSGVRDNIYKRLKNNYDPSKNPDVFGWLAGVSGGASVKGGARQSILFRAKGDYWEKLKDRPDTVSKEIIEGFDNMFGDKGAGMLEVEGGSKEVETPRKKFTDTVEYSPEQIKTMETEVSNSNVDVTKPYKHVKKLLVDQRKKMNNKGKLIVPTKPADVQATGPLKEVLRMESEHHGIPLEFLLPNATIPAGPYRNAAREQIYKDRIANIKALPDGTSPSGKSMGMATNKFGEFLVKGQRVRSAKTGSTQGLKEQELQLDRLEPTTEMVNEYLELFGIKPDGTFITKGEAKFDGAIKQQIIQRAALNVNQVARFQQGKKDAPIGEGRSPVMASRELAEQLSTKTGISKSKAKDLLMSLATRDYDTVSDLMRGEFSINDVIRALPPSLARDSIVEALLNMESRTLSDKIVLENEVAERELQGLTEKEFNAEQITSESNIKNVAIKNKLDPSRSSPTEIAKDPELVKWRKALDKKATERLEEKLGITMSELDNLVAHRSRQRVPGAITAITTEIGFGNKSRRQILPDGESAYLNLEGKKNGEALTDFLGLESKTKDGKDISWIEKVYSPDFSAHKKVDAKIEADMKGKSDKEIASAKIEAWREAASYTGKSKDYEATEVANAKLAEVMLEAKIEVAVENKGDYGSEWFLQDRALQTNATNGVTKSMVYNMRSIPARGSSKGKIDATNAKGIEVIKDNHGISTHWEHALQLLNNTQFALGIAKRAKLVKNKEGEPELDVKTKRDIKRLIEASQQDLIPKNGQLFNDAKGPTTFAEGYGKDGLVDLSNKSTQNVFTNKYARMENQYIVSGSNKGKTLAEVELQKYNNRKIKEALSRVAKKDWKDFEYNLERIQTERSAVEGSNKELKKSGLFGKGEKPDFVTASRALDNHNKAFGLGRKGNKKAKGMSAWDFDDTLARTKSDVLTTSPKGVKGKLTAEEFAKKGSELLKQGYEFDFSEFNKVTGGEPGPFLEKALARARKFGTEDQYIVTARAPEAAPAIYEFLKAQGLNIPLKNIVGLGNSTPEAKARWMLEKFAEGYNDMYFADDVMQNVKAVKRVLDQLDIKSKVQQALASMDFDANINKMMEESLGINANKRFSRGEGKARGKDIKRRRVVIPDSAADLELLIEPLYRKGAKGTADKKWFAENFFKPWERGINDYNTVRQTIFNDYKALRKGNKGVVKSLSKAVEGTNYTADQAVRVYIWNKAGHKIPGLAEGAKQRLVDHVNNNPELVSFAENLSKLTRVEGGLEKPRDTWWSETIATELSDVTKGGSRLKHINDWVEIKNEIFSEENLNKMESKLGSRWREAVEDMFERMETGRTRSANMGRISGKLMNYLNGSVGAIMNMNTRSGALQLISTVNFINHAENNPIAAAKAFANQPQYWKDFMHIMNSDMLKQRRQGLKINVTEAELASETHGAKDPAGKALSWILQKGYLPTKVADSFAIASGGATYYRNRIKMYEKQGVSTNQAEKQAWLDFQGVAERTQQSSRADLLSQQQTSFAGRLILPFANTPMQMNRIMLKELLDVSKGRYEGFYGENSLTHKLSKIGYYGFVQSAIFAGLQSALFATMLGSDGDDEDFLDKKRVRAVNTVADSFLRGMGIQGAVIAGVKNSVLKFIEQDKKGYAADYDEVVEALLNISPTVGSKYSKLDGAGNTYKYNKEQILEEGITGLTLDSPGLKLATQSVEAVTNFPVDRVLKKIDNCEKATNADYEAWQRLLMFLGWSSWDVGIENEGKKEHEEKKKKKGRKMIILD